jgi:hypothetical protein
MQPTPVLLPGMDRTGDLFSTLLAALHPVVPTVLMPARAVAAFAKLAPQARLVDIEGSHCLLQCSAPAVARTFEQFRCECE